MFYREGKSSLKCVLERGRLGKRGAGSPKGNQENGEGFVAVAGGSRARNPSNTVVTGWEGIRMELVLWVLMSWSRLYYVSGHLRREVTLLGGARMVCA